MEDIPQLATPKKHENMGIVRAVLAALTIYFLPQFLAGFAVALWAQSSDKTVSAILDDNTILVNFLFSVSSLIVGLVLVYALTRGYGGMRALGFKRIPFKSLLLVIPVYIVYFATLIFVFTVITNLNIGVDLDQEQTVGFESAIEPLQVVFAFISLVIIAPVFEEILFRGLLFTNMAKKIGFLPGAIISSGLFALAHLQLNVGIDTFLLGIGACWLVWKTGSLYPAILIHMLKNSIAFVILFLY